MHSKEQAFARGEDQVETHENGRVPAAIGGRPGDFTETGGNGAMRERKPEMGYGVKQEWGHSGAGGNAATNDPPPVATIANGHSNPSNVHHAGAVSGHGSDRAGPPGNASATQKGMLCNLN